MRDEASILVPVHLLHMQYGYVRMYISYCISILLTCSFLRTPAANTYVVILPLEIFLVLLYIIIYYNIIRHSEVNVTLLYHRYIWYSA